jgi:HEPN domain-containing protein
VAERSSDWFRQSQRDLQQARTSAAAGLHEWACFAAHQAAEKALKAAHQKLGGEGWGHVLLRLLEELHNRTGDDSGLLDAAKLLDRLYIPTRYPNGFAEGAPGDFFTAEDARSAIEHAERIVELCRRHLS